MLQLKKIHCHDRGKTRIRIDHLEISQGQLTGVVGPNGAGKTTLFKVICGELRHEGSLLFHGRPLHDWPALQRARHLSILPQTSQLTFPFTAKEVVELGLTPLSIGKHDARQQINHYMDLTDCLSLANQPYPLLSGGERQRVQLARVLLQLSQAEHAPLLLLDEPTSAQDLGHQHQILALAQQLCHQLGYGVLAIQHDLNQVMRYCDHCVQLSLGQLVNTGHPIDVLNQSTIEKYWQYKPQHIETPEGDVVFI